MKQFKFSLESLNDIKITIEKQQTREMKQIEAQIALLNNRKDESEKTLAAKKNEFNQIVISKVRANQLNYYSNYFKKIVDQMVLLQKKIDAQQKRKDECMQKLIATRKELKTLEKLREKQFSAYLSEMKKEEEKEINDLVSYKIISK